MGGADAGGLPGPTDAWITLAGLARDTSTIRLGTLVTSATFRRPGRWRSPSPASTRCPAAASSSASAPGGTRPSTRRTASRSRVGERFDRLEEQLAIITGLWRRRPGETFRLRRRALRASHDSPALPKPVQAGGSPIIVGGGGPAPDAGAGRAVRRRVQPAVRARSSGSSSSATAWSPRVRGDRPRPGVDRVLRRRSSLCVGADEAECVAPGGGDRPRARRAAPQRRRRHARRGRRDAADAGTTPAPSGSTCRSSTSPTSTISTPSSADRCDMT